MSKKIEVARGCIACGLCLSSEYMEENNDGTVRVKNAGILKDDELFRVKEIISGCPAHVLSIIEVHAKKKDEMVKYIDDQISSLKLVVPDIKTFQYDIDRVYIPTPYSPNGEYQYKYSSSNQAMNEVKNIIDREMYSKRTQLVQNVINEYRIEKLSGYMEYQEVENNFYYTANKRAEQILKNIINEVIICKADIVIPDDLKRINARPNSKEMWGMNIINDGILYRADSILSELTGEYYTLRSYAEYADWDDMETYETGMFGREKEVTKYCYRDVSKAYDEMAKDIVSALKWSFEEKVVGFAYEGIQNIVTTYQQQLVDELKEKAKELKKLI